MSHILISLRNLNYSYFGNSCKLFCQDLSRSTLLKGLRITMSAAFVPVDEPCVWSHQSLALPSSPHLSLLLSPAPCPGYTPLYRQSRLMHHSLFHLVSPSLPAELHCFVMLPQEAASLVLAQWHYIVIAFSKCLCFQRLVIAHTCH